jgi:hypothetical protein
MNTGCSSPSIFVTSLAVPDFDDLDPQLFSSLLDDCSDDLEVDRINSEAATMQPQTPCTRHNSVTGSDRSIREVLDSVIFF